MALMGVNLPLAYIGQESILRQTLQLLEHSMSDDELAPFFTGPLGWLTWG